MATSSGRVPMLDDNGRFPDRFAPPSVAVDAAAAAQAKLDAQQARTDAQAVATGLPAQATAAVTAEVVAQVDPKVTAAQSAQSGAVSAKDAAVVAKTAAEAAKVAAEAVGATNDTIMAAKIQDPASATAGALSAAIAPLVSEGIAKSVRLDALAAGQRAKATLTGTESEAARGVTASAATALNADSGMSLGVATLTDVGDLVTMPAAHGLAVGDPIGFGKITPAAGVDDAYRTYFVRTVPSSTTFTFSSEPGGTTQSVTADATAAALYRRERACSRQTGTIHPAFRITGTRPVQAGTANPRYDYIGPDPAIITYAPGTITATGMRIEVEYEGPRIGVLIRNFAAASAEIFVDGQLLKTVSTATMTADGVAANGVGRTTLLFDDARRRSISVEFRGNADFVGFDTVVGEPLIFPTGKPKGPRVLISGDSFTEGTGASSSRGYVQWLGRIMGWPDVWKCGSGGTGYVTDGPRLSLEKRYQNDIVAQNAQIVIIAQGINDINAPLEDVVAAAQTVWDAAKTAPKTQELIIIGPWPNGGNQGVISESLVAMDQALSAMAIAKGVRYISPISEGWKFALSDATHPNAAGHEYIATRIAGHLLVPYIASAT